MTEVPAQRQVRDHRRRHRRQLPGRPPRRLGWTDMVLIDKGPLPNPGGSTGHASNFIFPTDHNKEMAFLTLESQRQYIDLRPQQHVRWHRGRRAKPERLEEFNRRMTSAKAWGIDARLLTPAEIKELVPFINEEILLGGFYTPSVSCVDSLQTGTLMRDEAVATGALQVFANTEVLDIETETVDGPRSRPSSPTRAASRPSTSPSPAACGARASPRWPAPTSRSRPAVHQMADVGPIDILQQSGKEVAYPIVRDMDTFCYERQTAGSMEVGSYAHRPIFHHPDDIPSNEESRAVADRAAVHGRRLRPADRRGDRPDGDARRRRDQVRHQRPADR